MTLNNPLDQLAVPVAASGPIQRRALGDEVADALREAILAGRFEPGARLLEDQLAVELDVSRGPVREALLRLQEEGLVVHERHRGTVIVSLSVGDVVEIYTLRAVFERLAGEWACRNAADSDIARMEAALEDFGRVTDSSISERQRRAALARMDICFHDAFIAAAHHSRLSRAWETLRSQILMFFIQRGALRTDFRTTWLPDHDQITQALRRRDASLLEARITQHVEGTYARVMAYWTDPGPEPEHGNAATARPPAAEAAAEPQSKQLAPEEQPLRLPRRTVLADQVAESLREAITSGRLLPGQRTTEDDIAGQLKVSRSPVREAIQKLVQEGLVVHERHRGAMVVQISSHDVDEIFSMREALERLAAEFACRNATTADFDRLQEVLRRAERLKTEEVDDPIVQVTRLDIEFHDALFVASHNQRLYRIWSALRGQLLLFPNQVPSPANEHPVFLKEDHQLILDLLRARDVGGLDALMADHVGYTRAQSAQAIGHNDIIWTSPGGDEEASG